MARGQRKVRPGEKLKNTISATTWNSMIDALGWIENFKRNDKHQERESRDGIVQAKNESYADFAQFHVAALRNILFTPNENLPEFKNNYAFRTAIYEETDKFRWGITQQPTPNGAIGPVCVSGPTLARVNVSDHTHTHAKPIVGNHKQLESGNEGAKILWKEPDTGDDKWAVILLPEDVDGESFRLLTFELMQDRSADAPEERLPAIFRLSTYGDICDFPPSNPAAEALISNWATLVEIWPELNAQLVWFNQDQFPHARGPMTLAECGADTAGAIGTLAYRPDVSLEEDDAAEDDEEFCLKRFEVITCDQRSTRFKVLSATVFPWSLSDLNASGDTSLDEYYIPKQHPTPMNPWPFSQRARYTEFLEGTPPPPGIASLSKVINGSHHNYCGVTLDAGEIEWDETEDNWKLSTTRVKDGRAIIDLQYAECQIQKKVWEFRAYAVKNIADVEDWELAIQLYSHVYATGQLAHQIYAADGESMPVGDDTDICVLESATKTACLFESGDSEAWGDSGVVYGRIAGVKDVTNNTTDITFSRYYVWQPSCTILNRTDVVIEGDDTCPT